MEKFLKKVGLHLIWAFIAANLMIYFFMQKKPDFFLDYRYDYPFYNYHIQQVNRASNYTNIIFGDSKGQTINPKILGSSWLNLAEHASGFFQGFFTLKYHLEKNKIDTLLLYFSPSSILVYSNLDYLSNRAVPSRLVRFTDLKNLETVEAKYGNLYSKSENLNNIELKFKQIDRELRYAHFPFAYSKTFLSNLSSYSSPYAEEDAKIQSRLKAISENLGQDFCGESAFNSNIYFMCTPEKLQKECKPDPVNLSYLDSIVTLARNNKIVLYLGVAPLNETTYKVFNNSVLEKSINNFFKQTALKYPDLHLLVEPKFMPDSTFGDSSLHPNRKGAVIVANHLKEQLR